MISSGRRKASGIGAAGHNSRNPFHRCPRRICGTLDLQRGGRRAPKEETMDRTEHFRGRLLCGTETLIDPIEGHLKSHARPPSYNGEWTGFFEVPPEKRESLVDGNRYR